MHLWETSGLSVTRVEGYHVPSSLVRGEGSARMMETMAYRTLTWAILKTLRYVFLRDQGEPVDREDIANGPIWHQLEQHLKDWYSSATNQPPS